MFLILLKYDITDQWSLMIMSRIELSGELPDISQAELKK